MTTAHLNLATIRQQNQQWWSEDFFDSRRSSRCVWDSYSLPVATGKSFTDPHCLLRSAVLVKGSCVCGLFVSKMKLERCFDTAVRPFRGRVREDFLLWLVSNSPPTTGKWAAQVVLVSHSWVFSTIAAGRSCFVLELVVAFMCDPWLRFGPQLSFCCCATYATIGSSNPPTMT